MSFKFPYFYTYITLGHPRKTPKKFSTTLLIRLLFDGLKDGENVGAEGRKAPWSQKTPFFGGLCAVFDEEHRFNDDVEDFQDFPNSKSQKIIECTITKSDCKTSRTKFNMAADIPTDEGALEHGS